MANKELKNQEKLQQEKVEERVSKVEQFFNENKKTIWGCLCAVLVVGVGILAYNNFVRQPKIKEAQAQTFQAEEVFRNGEFELALKGDGNFLGFEQLVSEYGSAAGEAVYFYAGVCELQLGNWQEALGYLNQYKTDDTIMAARAIAAQATAYEGLEDYNKALEFYEKAARYADNAYAAEYLQKAGRVAEELGNTEKALALYKEIKDQYPATVQGMAIDKFITRIESSK
ncbi:MAG: tetratricopeptide repeat protein [Bacteroidales bacterium]|nr:tetratricopeptide repeat protein [Bacteroidales bacterium]